MSSDKMPEEWLLIKSGLYYRPNCRGYTGVLDEAGLYTKEFVEKYISNMGEVTTKHVSDALEFMPDTFNDTINNHTKDYKKRIAELERVIELQTIAVEKLSDTAGAREQQLTERDEVINLCVEALDEMYERGVLLKDAYNKIMNKVDALGVK